MAASVRTFSRAHLSTDASYTLVLDRLDGSIVRLEQLAAQQQGGFTTKHSSVQRRKDIRRKLQRGLLRYVVHSAGDADTERAGLAEKFRLPSTSATNAAFRAAAIKLLEEGRANQELLVKHGLSATLLDELDATIKQFDASLEESDDGKQAHVAARAEMKELSDEIVRIVAILDGFNQYRFQNDPELIVAWESARHVVTTPPKEEQSTTPSNPVPSGLEPAA
jgi:hypothetical protein